MNDLPGRGDVNPYGIPVPNPHEREGPDENEDLEYALRQRNEARAEVERLREALREIAPYAAGSPFAEKILKDALGDTEHG